MKVRFYWESNIQGCDGFEEEEVPDDLTGEELSELATEKAMEAIQPYGYWRKITTETEDKP